MSQSKNNLVKFREKMLSIFPHTISFTVDILLFVSWEHYGSRKSDTNPEVINVKRATK